MSLSGMGQWPKSFYVSEWETILDNADMIRTGIAVGRELDVFPTRGAKIEREPEELALIQAAFAQALAVALAKADS